MDCSIIFCIQDLQENMYNKIKKIYYRSAAGLST
jgi:hypothetical protein